MTWIQYAWWVLEADRDDPEVAEIMSRISPGWTPDVQDLYASTELALVSAVLVLGRIPPEARQVKPVFFSIPEYGQLWSEMLKQETFDSVSLDSALQDSGLPAQKSSELLHRVMNDFSPVDMVGYYAKRVGSGYSLRRAGK